MIARSIPLSRVKRIRSSTILFPTTLSQTTCLSGRPCVSKKRLSNAFCDQFPRLQCSDIVALLPLGYRFDLTSAHLFFPLVPEKATNGLCFVGHRLGRRHVPDRCLHRRALHQTREVGEPERRSGLSPSSRLLPCGGRACSRGLSGTCKKPQPQLPSQGAVTVKVNAEVPGASGFASTSVWLRRANRLSETPLESMVSGTHEACPIGNRDCATRIPYCITLFSPTIVDEIPRLQV